MPKSIHINNEYEARLMLNEEQYSSLLSHYKNMNLKKRELTNLNSYFDTEELTLTELNMVLRTREINTDKYELTLKVKEDQFDKEYNLPISKEEYQKLKDNFELKESKIKDILISFGIDINKIKFITDLLTYRLEVTFPNYLLVIDKNLYRNKVDYNVEVESTSREDAIKYLNESVKYLNIEYKKGYIYKSRRALLDL